MNRHFSLSPTRHETQNAYHFALCISKITSNKRCKEKTQNAYKERGNPQMGMLSSHLHRPRVSSLSSALLAKALAPGARADLRTIILKTSMGGGSEVRRCLLCTPWLLRALRRVLLLHQHAIGVLSAVLPLLDVLGSGDGEGGRRCAHRT
jgi:hypothetical protein